MKHVQCSVSCPPCKQKVGGRSKKFFRATCHLQIVAPTLLCIEIGSKYRVRSKFGNGWTMNERTDRWTEGQVENIMQAFKLNWQRHKNLFSDIFPKNQVCKVNLTNQAGTHYGKCPLCPKQKQPAYDTTRSDVSVTRDRKLKTWRRHHSPSHWVE